VRVYEKYGFSRVQEFTVALLTGPWPGMLLAMRLPRQWPGLAVSEGASDTGWFAWAWA